MRKLKIVAFSLLLANSFWSCEKDDICAEGTSVTPNVVIEFYDAANPTKLKIVNGLRVKASGFSTYRDQASGSKITVPLKVNDNVTTLEFIQNGSDTNLTNDNTDILTFNYTHQDVFVSRACGFKTVFQLSNTPALSDIGDGLWISNAPTTSIQVIQPNIQNENETHIKIYF